MSRAAYNNSFVLLAQDVVPPHLALKDFSGQKLHPFIKPDGGWDNNTTIFGLIIPDACGKSLIIQVSDETEKALATNAINTRSLLREDLVAAVKLWDSRAIDHTHAFENPVKL